MLKIINDINYSNNNMIMMLLAIWSGFLLQSQSAFDFGLTKFVKILLESEVCSSPFGRRLFFAEENSCYYSQCDQVHEENKILFLEW